MITYFVITFESFDTEGFVSALRDYDSNGIIVVWNYSGSIRIAHRPRDFEMREHYRFYRSGTWTEKSWFKWPSFLLSSAWIIASVALRTKVRRFYVTGGDVLLWVAQMFKVLGRIEMTIATLDDWSLPPRASSFGDWINRKKFLFNDRLLNWMDTKVIVFNKEVFETRDRYWKGTTDRNSIVFENRWLDFIAPRRKRPASPGNQILLLGSMRLNFGIETLFDLLPELNREHGIGLRVIGIESDLYRRYKAKCDESGLSRFIEWRGFVDNAKLPEEAAHCFCGYDMQENEINNSKHVIAGRVVNYLSQLLVPVISVHSGAIVPFLAKRQMAIVCEPRREAIKDAILEAKANYEPIVTKIEAVISDDESKSGVERLLFLAN